MQESSDEPLALQGKLVAIFPPDEGDEAKRRLEAEGFDFEDISQREVPTPTREPGLSGVLRTVAAAFGDELRVLESIDQAVAKGKVVLVIQSDAERAARAADTVTEAKAEAAWDFRGWTFAQVGPSEPEAEV